MTVQLGIIRGASQEEVLGKKFNIYVGISLGNKDFTKEYIKDSLDWALKHSKERTGLLIADTLHAINYQIKDGKSIESARKKALKKGDELIVILKEIIDLLPQNKQNKIDIIRWDDIKKNPGYEESIIKITKEFNENKEFKESILDIIKAHFENSHVHNSPGIIQELSKYIIDELPTLLQGFTFNNIRYNCYTYPEDNILTKFIEDISNKKRFKEIHNILEIKENISVELKAV